MREIIDKLQLDNETSLNTGYLDLLVDGLTSFPAGRLGWDQVNHTASLGLEFGSSLQLGQETIRYARDVGSAAGVANGDFVFIAGVDAGSIQTLGLVNASVSPRHAGVATSPFSGEYGYVVKDGIARDVPITGLTKGLPLYADPTTPGGLTNTSPEWPDHIIFVGAVVKDNGDGTGDIDVSPYIVQREVPTPVALTSYSAKPARDTTENIHGGFVVLDTGHDLSAGNLVLSGALGQGSGKIMMALTAGTDAVGTITVTGDTVDRDTGVVTPNDTVNVTVDGLTTDSSGPDVNGITVLGFVDIYGTDKWFTGDVTISSSDTTITSMDTYHCSYEQFNDARIILLDTIDLNYYSYGTVAASAYLYTVVGGNGGKFAITSVAGYSPASHLADRMYRRRISNLGIQLDGSADGVFVQVKWFGNNQFADAGIKVWANVLL
jgi:hypothetical protein